MHEVGTRADDGQWRGPVESHHSSTGPGNCPGYRVQVAGLPFPEHVTPEHCYWVQQKRAAIGFQKVGTGVPPSWVQAKNLILSAHEIGMPIDSTEVPAPAVETVTNVGGGRGFRKLRTVQEYELLADPEWWWVIGYWLGDGNIHRSHRDGRPNGITLAIADGDSATTEKIAKLFEKHGWTGAPTQRCGCQQLTFFNETIAILLNSWIHYEGTERGKGKGKKVPPMWAERLPLALQAELVKGLNAADGSRDTTEGAIISNTSMEMLLSVRRMLARLGVPSSIRKAHKGGPMQIQGRTVHTQPSYTIRFWAGAEHLGVNHRFIGKFSRPYIEDGWLWSRVMRLSAVEEGEFRPIITETHDYLTPFGRSHNGGVALKERAFALLRVPV